MGKRKHGWVSLWLLFAWALAPSPMAFAESPEACRQPTANWPPSGTWNPRKGQMNLGQSAYSGFTQIWTHVYNGGVALDEIMFSYRLLRRCRFMTRPPFRIWVATASWAAC